MVSASAQAALDAVVAEQDRTLCAGFEARGCFADEPPCAPPGVAACISGECTEFEGLPSSAGDAGAASGPVALSAADAGKAVSLSVGQRLEVTLGTIGSANWGDPKLSSTSLRFAQRFLPRLQNPGGPTTVFVFQAERVGSCEVTIDHPTRGPFKLTVTVR